MGQTSNPTLRYPDGTDRPRAVQLKNLAEDTHAAFQQFRAEMAMPPPRRLAKDGAASIPNNTNTVPMGWVSAPGDPGNTAGGIQYSGGLLHVPTAGIYVASFGGFWASNSTGGREFQFQQNGAQRESLNTRASSDPMAYASLSVVVWAEAGDTLGFAVRQGSGGSLNFGGTSPFCWMQCAKVA